MKWPCACLLLAAACSALPKDADSTLERVRAEHRFALGIVAPGAGGDLQRRQAAFLALVARETGARPVTRQGPLEPLLLDLEEGRLDMVIGAVASDSPWRTRVAVVEPLAEPGEDQPVIFAPMARNGENAWVMLIERHARAVREGR
ncbi:MAG TPA: hypothetical protein VGX37_09530 [Allosphingosinicella sp.]|jgi:hypothetical protein|nr:hypothetical protein [Allosphingosinicella sp.]